jgi:DNA polymerase-3 subunit gamma/tau
MLTTEASNALLKTLEEPPAHVMFILATTNPEKLIPTIRSRATTIHFKNASNDEIVRSLQRVTKGERVKAEDEALEKIAEASGGSFRDAIKIIEQMLAEDKKIKSQEVDDFIYGGSISHEDMIPLLVKKDTKKALEIIENLTKNGQSIDLFIDSLVDRLRKALLAKVGVGDEDIKELSKDEIISLISIVVNAKAQLRGTSIEQLPLEIAVIEWCEENSEDTDQNGQEERKISPKKEKAKKESKRKKVSSPVQKISSFDSNLWTKIITTVKSINTPVEALLRASRPVDFDGKKLTLGVFYRFHKEKLEQVQNMRFLEGIIEDIIGESIRVECKLSEPPKKQVEEKKDEVVLTEGKDEDIIRVAEEIFN